MLFAIAPAPPAPTPDAYGIFDRARHVWAAQRYPAFLSYTIAVNVTERGVDKTRHYHLTLDSQSQTIYVNPISDEEQAAPPVPAGITWHLLPKRQNKTLFDKKIGNPGEAVDYLGVPKLSPTYAFGLGGLTDDEQTPSNNALVAQIRQEFNDPIPLEKQREQVTTGGMKVIAVATSRTRQYDITYDGMESIDGHDCYHLSLKPARGISLPPGAGRLRDLWVDTQTYQTRQLVSSGNFTGTQVPWLVRFADVDGAMYIASETAQGSLGIGDHRYERASVEFQSVAQTSRPQHQDYFISGQTFSEPDGTGSSH